jgi:MerR family transcriptional regulator, light-induced transcriptional regulator
VVQLNYFRRVRPSQVADRSWCTHNGGVTGNSEAIAPAEASGLTVAAVARRMGVAPATLRTWDRRYGVGPSEHRPGAHRRYTPVDLARLEHMRRLVIAGIPPAEAARTAREVSFDDTVLAPVTQLPTPVPTPDVEAEARAGGGRVVPMPGGAQAARGLARAAQSLDTATCTSIVSETMDRRGVVWTWDNLIVPVLNGVGQQWSDSGRGIEVEHALSAAIQDALSGHVRSASAPVNNRSVLLACAPDEMHSLVLWAVAAGLAERRIGARILGASLPASALASAVQRLGPAVVFVWAQIPDTADPAILSAIPAFRPAATVLIGGPGWRHDGGLLPGVSRVSDLTDTITRIARAVGE